MEVTVKKLRKPATVYKIAPSGNSELAGRKTVRVASVAKCSRQKRFRGDLYCLKSTFRLVYYELRVNQRVLSLKQRWENDSLCTERQLSGARDI